MPIKAAAIALDEGDEGDDVVVGPGQSKSVRTFQLCFEASGALVEDEGPCIGFVRFVDALPGSDGLPFLLVVKDVKGKLSVGLSAFDWASRGG